MGVRGPDDRWEISAFSKNLLDQTRVIRASAGNGQLGTLTPGLSLDSGYRTAVVSQPREFGISAKFSW